MTNRASRRDRKLGPTPYCGVVSKRIKKAVKAERTDGDFLCIICKSRFTRAAGVCYHFPRCVEAHGNPLGNRWDDDPSCASRETPERSTALPRPVPKRQRTSRSSPGPSAVDPRNPKTTTRAAPVAETRTHTTGQRVTRSETLRSRLDLGTISTETSAGPKTKATKPSIAQPKRAQAEPSQKQNTSVRERAKPQPRSKDASGIGKRPKYEVEENLPPLHEPGPIFHDLTLNALVKTPLKEALKTLSQKQIYIATMCSGTESPLLALAEIQNGKPRP